MKIHWKTAFVKTIVWLTAEIVLNLLGVDSLADYSEFIYEHQIAALSHLHQPAIVTPAPKRVKLSFYSKVLSGELGRSGGGEQGSRGAGEIFTSSPSSLKLRHLITSPTPNSTLSTQHSALSTSL